MPSQIIFEQVIFKTFSLVDIYNDTNNMYTKVILLD